MANGNFDYCEFIFLLNILDFMLFREKSTNKLGKTLNYLYYDAIVLSLQILH